MSLKISKNFSKWIFLLKYLSLPLGLILVVSSICLVFSADYFRQNGIYRNKMEKRIEGHLSRIKLDRIERIIIDDATSDRNSVKNIRKIFTNNKAITNEIRSANLTNKSSRDKNKFSERVSFNYSDTHSYQAINNMINNMSLLDGLHNDFTYYRKQVRKDNIILYEYCSNGISKAIYLKKNGNDYLMEGIAKNNYYDLAINCSSNIKTPYKNLFRLEKIKRKYNISFQNEEKVPEEIAERIGLYFNLANVINEVIQGYENPDYAITNIGSAMNTWEKIWGVLKGEDSILKIIPYIFPGKNIDHLEDGKALAAKFIDKRIIDKFLNEMDDGLASEVISSYLINEIKVINDGEKIYSCLDDSRFFEASFYKKRDKWLLRGYKEITQPFGFSCRTITS